jgi:hypothetical protein
MSKSSYIVASLGRCGSQMVTVALHEHIWGFDFHAKPFLKKTRPFIREYPKEFKPDIVHKTHLYPTEYPQNCKVVFTFGDPLNIVLSVLKKSSEPAWGPAHFKNMKADWSRVNDILREDILGLEKMFDAFYQKQSCPSMCVRYETMWENEENMSDFFGFTFKLPIKKERDANRIKEQLSQEQVEQFNIGYSSLIEKINKAKDCKIWSKK